MFNMNDSFTPIIRQWNEIDKNNLIETIIPSKSSLEETQQLFQSSKAQLQSLTKLFYSKNTENYPRDDGITLLGKYNDIFSILSSKTKENEASVAELFTKLATVDDPSIIIQMTISKLKAIPNFNEGYEEIQKQTETEREKSENVAKLLEKLNDLKKKCDEQISIAQKTAISQFQIDLDLSLSEYQTKKQHTKSELKEIQSKYNSLTLQKEMKLNELKTKEMEIEQNFSNRQEQIDSLVSELNEATKLYQETESQQKEIEESRSIINLENQLGQINKETKEVDDQLDELKWKIEETHKPQKNQDHFQETISHMHDSIKSIEKVINEVPQKAEFEKLKNETKRIQNILEKEKKKRNCESNLNEFELDIKSKKSELDSQNQIFNDLKSKYLVEKSRIDSLVLEIENDHPDNELISVFLSQINDIQKSIENNRNLSAILLQQNQIKLQSKEKLENEVTDLKNRVRNNENVIFDSENPGYSFSRFKSSDHNYDYFGEESHEDTSFEAIDRFFNSTNLKSYCTQISNTVKTSSRNSKFIRYGLFIFILLIHLFLIYIVFM